MCLCDFIDRNKIVVLLPVGWMVEWIDGVGRIGWLIRGSLIGGKPVWLRIRKWNEIKKAITPTTLTTR